MHRAMLERAQGSSLGVCVVLGCVGNHGAVRGDRVRLRLLLEVCVRTELSCLGKGRRTACFRVSGSGRGAVAWATAGQQHRAVVALAVDCGDSFVVSYVLDARERGTWADHPRRSASYPSCLMIALVRVVVACTFRRVGRSSGVWCSGGASGLSACTRLGAGGPGSVSSSRSRRGGDADWYVWACALGGRRRSRRERARSGLRGAALLCCFLSV